MGQNVALDTNLAQDVVSALVVAVAAVLTAALLAAGDVQPQQEAVLAAAAGPEVALAACLPQAGLKASGVVGPVEPGPVLPLARLPQDAAVAARQVNWLAV